MRLSTIKTVKHTNQLFKFFCLFICGRVRHYFYIRIVIIIKFAIFLKKSHHFFIRLFRHIHNPPLNYLLDNKRTIAFFCLKSKETGIELFMGTVIKLNQLPKFFYLFICFGIRYNFQFIVGMVSKTAIFHKKLHHFFIIFFRHCHNPPLSNSLNHIRTIPHFWLKSNENIDIGAQ